MVVPEEKRGGERVKWVKGIKYMTMEGNLTSHSEHAIAYTGVEL